MIQLQYLGTLSEYNTIRLKYDHKFNIIVLGQPYSQKNKEAVGLPTNCLPCTLMPQSSAIEVEQQQPGWPSPGPLGAIFGWSWFEFKLCPPCGTRSGPQWCLDFSDRAPLGHAGTSI